jgi:hypothetical protein
MTLFWRIWFAVSAVNVLVLAIFLGLAGLQFASINAALVGERLVVIAGRTVAPFAASARLGLPLSEVRNAPALLERARRTDEDIVALYVFDDAGKIVHSTGGATPVAIPAEAAAARRAARGAAWYRETPEGFMGGVDVTAANASGYGGILVVYPGRGNLTQVRSMIAELLEGALAALMVSGVVGTLLLRYGLAGAIRDFQAIDTTYGAFERSTWRQGAGTGWTPTAESLPLLSKLRSAEASYHSTGRAVAAAEERSK